MRCTPHIHFSPAFDIAEIMPERSRDTQYFCRTWSRRLPGLAIGRYTGTMACDFLLKVNFSNLISNCNMIDMKI